MHVIIEGWEIPYFSDRNILIAKFPLYLTLSENVKLYLNIYCNNTGKLHKIKLYLGLFERCE